MTAVRISGREEGAFSPQGGETASRAALRPLYEDKFFYMD